MKESIRLVLMSLFVFGLTSGAYAEVLTAANGGWSINFDTLRQIEQGEDTPREGLMDWVDPLGRDHIWEGSWWGRDNSGYGEGPLSSLTLESWSNPAPNQISMRYTEPGSNLYVDLWYGLTGSGLASSISERAMLTNANNNPINLSIFEYADFDLTDTDNNDNAFGNVFGITQYDNWSRVSVIPVSSIPNHFQIASFSSLVDSLSDASSTILNDSGSPYGPGDATFAFQWDFTLAPGETYTIEKIKTLTTTPEPVSCALFLFGGGALALVRRKKK